MTDVVVPATLPQLRPFTFALVAPPVGKAGRGTVLRHGITGRVPAMHREGDMSFVTGGDAAAVFASRRAWAAAIGVEAANVVAARQVHGTCVARVSKADRGRGARSIDDAIPRTDALVTDEVDVPLLMCFADCTPLMFHDPVRGVAGLAHAGWRGTVADVAGATVRAMVEGYGSAPSDIRAGIGPAIGPCCYRVGEDVAAAWRALRVDGVAVLRPAPGAGGQWFFDLPRANRLLLRRAGLLDGHVQDAGICTACRVDAYFSHRAEAGRAGRFAAIVALENANTAEDWPSQRAAGGVES